MQKSGGTDEPRADRMGSVGREWDTSGSASMVGFVPARILFLRRSRGTLGFRIPAGLMAAAFSALFGCASADKPSLAPGQVSRTVLSPVEEAHFRPRREAERSGQLFCCRTITLLAARIPFCSRFIISRAMHRDSLNSSMRSGCASKGW